MNNKLLPFCSLVLSTGLLFSASNANAENVFTSSASKAGSAIVNATKATSNVAVKTAKIITPDSFFIEGSMLELNSGSQVYGTENGNSTYNAETVNNEASGAKRFGIGYNVGADKELQISYFRYRSDDTNSTLSSGDGFYGNPDSSYYNYKTANAKFEHKVNVIDVDIAKTKVVDNNLNLQISGGLKYANYERDVTATYYDFDFSSTGDTIYTKSTFKGFGPKIGVEADYKLIGGFSLFGGANVAILAGTNNVKRTFNSDDDLGSFNIKNSTVTPIIAGDLGIKWSKENIIRNSDFAIKIGYHLENWQSVVGEGNYIDDYITATNTSYENLALSGAYLRTTFSF